MLEPFREREDELTFTIVMVGFKLEGTVSARIYSTFFGRKRCKRFFLRQTPNHKPISILMGHIPGVG